MKQEIRAIIFDIGGVLDKGEIMEHYVPLCKALKLNIDEFQRARRKYIDRARVGKISTRQYLSCIAKDLGLKYDDLLKNWIKYKRKALIKDRGVEKIIRKLRKQGYKVGSLTNVIEIHHKIRHEKRIYDLFDFNICSFKEGIDKPKLKIYKLLLKKLKLNPKQIIFVDDYEGYLKPAKKLGMKTILFKNNKQLIKCLRKLGILTKR